MNKSNDVIEKAIRDFHERAVEVEAVADALGELVGMQPESRVMTALFGTLGDYMRALGEPLGIDGWLEWWWLECGLGEHPKQAKLPGEALRDINTLDDMVALMIDAEREVLKATTEVFVPEDEWNAHWGSVQEHKADSDYAEGDEFKLVRLLVGACTTYKIVNGAAVPISISFPKGVAEEGAANG